MRSARPRRAGSNIYGVLVFASSPDSAALRSGCGLKPRDFHMLPIYGGQRDSLQIRPLQRGTQAASGWS